MGTPYNVDTTFMIKFGDWIRKQAKQLKDNAGHNGDHHDGGASRLNAEWDCYLAGFNNSDFPVRSHGNVKYVELFFREQDPEYTEYLRLKEKFKE